MTSGSQTISTRRQITRLGTSTLYGATSTPLHLSRIPNLQRRRDVEVVGEGFAARVTRVRGPRGTLLEGLELQAADAEIGVVAGDRALLVGGLGLGGSVGDRDAEVETGGYGLGEVEFGAAAEGDAYFGRDFGSFLTCAGCLGSLDLCVMSCGFEWDLSFRGGSHTLSVGAADLRVVVDPALVSSLLGDIFCACGVILDWSDRRVITDHNADTLRQRVDNGEEKESESGESLHFGCLGMNFWRSKARRRD